MFKNNPQSTEFQKLLNLIEKWDGKLLDSGLEKLAKLPFIFNVEHLNSLMSAILKLSKNAEFLPNAIKHWCAFMEIFAEALPRRTGSVATSAVVAQYKEIFVVLTKQLDLFRKSKLQDSEPCILATDKVIMTSASVLLNLLNELEPIKESKKFQYQLIQKEILNILNIFIEHNDLLTDQMFNFELFKKILQCNNDEIKVATTRYIKDYFQRLCKFMVKTIHDWMLNVEKDTLRKESLPNIIGFFQPTIANFYEWQTGLLSVNHLGNLAAELQTQNMLRSCFTFLNKVHDTYELDENSLRSIIEAIHIINFEYFLEFIVTQMETKDNVVIEKIFKLLKEKNEDFFPKKILLSYMEQLQKSIAQKKEFLSIFSKLEKYSSVLMKISVKEKELLNGNGKVIEAKERLLFSGIIENEIIPKLVLIFKNAQEQETKQKIAESLFQIKYDIGRLKPEKITSLECEKILQKLPSEIKVILSLLSQEKHEAFIYGENLRSFFNNEPCLNIDIVATINFNEAIGFIKKNDVELKSLRSVDDSIIIFNCKEFEIKIFCGQRLDSLYEWSKKLEFTCNSLFFDFKNKCIYDGSTSAWKDGRSKILVSQVDNIYIANPAVIFRMVRFVGMGYSLSKEDKKKLEQATKYFLSLDKIELNPKQITDLTFELHELFLEGKAEFYFEKIVKLDLLALLVGVPVAETERSKMAKKLAYLDEEYKRSRQVTLKHFLIMFDSPLDLDSLEALPYQGLLGVIAYSEKISLEDASGNRWLLFDILNNSMTPKVVIKAAIALAQLKFDSPVELLLIGTKLTNILYSDLAGEEVKIEAAKLLGQCGKIFQDVMKELEKGSTNKNGAKQTKEQKQIDSYLKQIKQLRKEIQIALICVAREETLTLELRSVAYKALALIYQYQEISIEKHKELLFFSTPKSEAKGKQLKVSFAPLPQVNDYKLL